MPPVAILDIDGTLVDTNYHHAIAWYRAFRQHGIVLPLWKIHRHIGMGGDQLVASLTSSDVDESIGDDIRSAEKALYMALIDEVQPVSEAREFIADLKQRGHTVVLASSAKEDEVEHYLDLLDARGLADDWTMSADVSSTKPAPDLVKAAMEKAGGSSDSDSDAGSGSGSGSPAVMVGDTPWDIEAAARADVPTIAVITGGFSRAELEEAGAAAVFESVAELRSGLDETPLAD
jgi:phosphoglycolate phosphatase-like HAD superfamily hydrolase